ncbi:MAG: KpsF/GutQ family sugar-phosphate isomerase [Thermoplasmatales archaeon]|nr:KpsF/GutQ family sugar-phosphate isomerase [Thermoplasmatales archaeon]
MKYLDDGRRVFDLEIKALMDTKDSLDESFSLFADSLCKCEGRVIFSGIGKSGHIAKKITATMQSLGIKSYFMHPAEALHGDLGMITKEDTIVAISNSGETDEILNLIPTINKVGTELLCITGRNNSTLARNSKMSIILPPMEEAYLDSVPTSSTTATLAVGDALAVSIAKNRGFEVKEFSVFHPKGTLGKRMTLKVEGMMKKNSENPSILSGSTVKDAVLEMCKKPIGGTNIVDSNGVLLGVFTDGDLRRLFNRNPENAMSSTIDDVMTKEPVCISPNILVYDSIDLIKEKGLSFFPVVDDDKKLLGTIRLMDVVKSGLMED